MSFRFQTPRLILRPWLRRDRASLERMTSDGEMMRFINGRPWTDEEVDELIARQHRHLENHGICFGAAELIGTGEVVGLIGMQPMVDGDFEIGWWIWRDHWRQGLATEAIRPFVAHATAMGLSHVWAVIDPPNTASIRVAEKLGMRRDRKVSIDELLPGRGDFMVFLYKLDLARAQAT